MDVRHHLAPDPTRPDVEWSVALGYGELSISRFVIHDVTEAETAAFLEERGHDAEAALRTLRAAGGEPRSLAVGVDGLRTKLHWYLAGDDPHLLRLDLHPVDPPVVKRYLRLEAARAAEALDLVPGPLRAPLRWLLAQPPFDAGGLAYLSLLRPPSGPSPCPTVHAQIAPEPERLAAGDPTLLRADLVRRLLDRLHLSHHLGVVHERLLTPPMGWTSRLSLTLGADATPGVIVHARPRPT